MKASSGSGKSGSEKEKRPYDPCFNGRGAAAVLFGVGGYTLAFLFSVPVKVIDGLLGALIWGLCLRYAIDFPKYDKGRRRKRTGKRARFSGRSGS